MAGTGADAPVTEEARVVAGAGLKHSRVAAAVGAETYLERPGRGAIGRPARQRARRHVWDGPIVVE